MLAKLTRELPVGDGLHYEPKWDGFRCLAFRDHHDVDLRSRNGRPLARYFPEIVKALMALDVPVFALDGEILILGSKNADFNALLSRLHPAASRVTRLSAETPATYVAFDVLAVGSKDFRSEPFVDRRGCLESLIPAQDPRIKLTPITKDPVQARGWLSGELPGVDGVVVKEAGLLYEPGRRAMVKVKLERTADCVVGGFRWSLDAPVVAALLLGVFDPHGRLLHIGVASSFSTARRAELVTELEPCVTALEGHPWEQGFGIAGGRLGNLPGAAGRWDPDLERDWVPLRPVLVCEVAYDRWEGDRFRHAARFLRWRPDLEPAECTLQQFEP